ncbi:MAG: adenylate kinase [Bacteroidota bacterium]|nr:adenylate kinase [Bacteroidota bacterium]|tara:strand:+ start:4079 stop:4657 length:579 start_codon:yes stop_codon:yes gene_type:complete
MKNIIIFGPPGSGKGTQAELLVKNKGLSHISTGDIFRKNIKGSTKLGVLASSYIENGQLVPDNVTSDMLSNEIESISDSKGFIFDGYPRTINQAEFFESLLLKKNMKLSMVLSLDVNEEILLKRLLNRGLTSGRDDDRNENIILNRIRVYNNQTSVLKKYYIDKLGDNFHSINGEHGIQSIFKSIDHIINNS